MHNLIEQKIIRNEVVNIHNICGLMLVVKSSTKLRTFSLFKKHTNGKPIRSLSVRACDLEPIDHVQLSLLPDVSQLQKQEDLEAAMDDLRNRVGHFSVQKGLMLTDKELSALDPKNDHIIHPMSFFN